MQTDGVLIIGHECMHNNCCEKEPSTSNIQLIAYVMYYNVNNNTIAFS